MRFKLFDFLDRQINDADLEAFGVKVAERVFFRELAIYIAVSCIANTVSKCEIKTFVGGEEVQDELYYKLNVSPNPNQNSSQFMSQLIQEYFYDGKALAVEYRKNLYCADSFGVDEHYLKEHVFNDIAVGNETIPKKYKASDAFYFTLDGKQGSPVPLVRGIFSEYDGALNAAISSFISSHGEKYKLVLENVQAGDPVFAEHFNTILKKQLSTFMNSDRAVFPQFRGQSLEKVETPNGASSQDIVAFRKEIFDTTAQAFKIPLSMMYGNITNMNEIVKVYQTVCIDPLAKMLSEEFTRKTTNFETWKRGNRVIVDTSAINHIDVLEAADKADKLIASGVATIDDIRKRLGMQPLNTDFSSAHYLTKNYAPVDEVAEPLEGGEMNA